MIQNVSSVKKCPFLFTKGKNEVQLGVELYGNLTYFIKKIYFIFKKKRKCHLSFPLLSAGSIKKSKSLKSLRTIF